MASKVPDTSKVVSDTAPSAELVEAYAVFEAAWKDGYYDQFRAARIPFAKIEKIIPALRDLCAVMYLEGKVSALQANDDSLTKLKDKIDGSV